MTEKRFTVLYGIDENPFEWDIIDNQRNAIIKQGNGIAICNELNELCEENKELKHENVNIMSDLDYFRTKNGSLEEGLFKQDRKIAKLEKENKELKQSISNWQGSYDELYEDNLKLEKELHLAHMRTMFSTVKSFNGDVSKRYYYSEETDRVYDTANTYGQYDKILDKKEIAMLLNEYETMLNGDLND